MRIQPDLAGQRLQGEATIRVHSLTETPISALELDAGSAIQVASVIDGGAAQWFERKGALLVIVLTNPLTPDERRSITVRYAAGPAPGLKFFPDQVYGSAVADWLPSSDRPAERATLHLAITAPADIKTAAGGQPVAPNEWRLDSPAAPSWFGFAAGRFSEATSQAGGVKLRVMGASAQVFDPTAAALRYLADRTGKPFPGSTYTQVFCHGDASRAMAGGLALLPESAADNQRLIAGELARQWYGVSIAVRDWSDLWLSDGLSGFLANTFVGQRLGNQAYMHEIESSREAYNQLRAQGKDRPLDDSESTWRGQAAGGIPLHKGVAFLYVVKELVGDSGFWEALRAYTSAHWGQTATSEDFQSAFLTAHTGAKGTVKAVNNLFDLWVFGVPSRTK